MATETAARTRSHVMRWPRSLYERASEVGLFDGRRVELLGGEIVEMAAKGPVHSVTTGDVAEVLALAFPKPQYTVRNQEPLALGEWDEPEPDVTVAVGRRHDYQNGHPTALQAVLVVEVAESTLDDDLGHKANMYAAAEIADYWVVAPGVGQVFVLRERERAAQTRSRTGWRYAERRVYGRDDVIVPLANPDIVVAVNRLLSGQEAWDLAESK